MSKIGQQSIKLDKVKVRQEQNFLIVIGAKGELKQKLHPHIDLTIKDDLLTVKVKNPQNKFDRALWGLYRSLIANMVTGVTTGFEKRLEIEGVGYKANVSGQILELFLGFSHPVQFPIPKGIEIKVVKNQIIISGLDKWLVGQVAAQIRAKKKPEPYKGKGIKYHDEIIRRKAGKVVKGEGDAGED